MNTSSLSDAEVAQNEYSQLVTEASDACAKRIMSATSIGAGDAAQRDLRFRLKRLDKLSQDELVEKAQQRARVKEVTMAGDWISKANFEPATAKQIRQLVDVNDHGGAYALAAQAIGRTDLAERFAQINRRHLELGHLPLDLQFRRDEASQALMAALRGPSCRTGPNAKMFEVTAAGFDGSSSETDDCVFWVLASTEETVKSAIADTGAVFCGEVSGRSPGDADFTLPGQSMQFSSALLEKASAHRNAKRPHPKM